MASVCEQTSLSIPECSCPDCTCRILAEMGEAAAEKGTRLTYDSRPDTHEHIAQVRGLVLGVAGELTERAHRHDRSKLVDPEREVFDRVTPELAKLTYGSDEYKASLASMGEALRHHYAENDHHPEHWPDGIAEMNLIQLTEMLCDWIAATRRHEDGDIYRSIEQNAQRFGYGEEVKRLLTNTVGAILCRELRVDVDSERVALGFLPG